MILDSLLKVSAAQQITADAASGNTVDTGNVTPKRELGAGEEMALVVAISAVGTNTGSAKIEVVQSANADLSSPVIIGERDLVTADIVVGAIFVIPLSAGKKGARYYGAYYDITGTVDFTVDAYLTSACDAAVMAETYAKGYTV